MIGTNVLQGIQMIIRRHFLYLLRLLRIEYQGVSALQNQSSTVFNFPTT